MKPKIAHLLLFSSIALFVTFCGESAAAEKPQDNANNKKALEEIRKEKKVVEAFINDANVLYVSVADDGTGRDGFAMYLCNILSEQQATTKLIKVMKVNSINDPNATNAYGVQLGEASCK